MKPRVIPLVLCLLCLFTFTSCNLPVGTNNKKVVAYLKAVGPDFEKSKENLKVFDEEYTDDLDGITKILESVQESKSGLQTMMDTASKQAVPEKPKEIAGFHSSLIQYYKDSIKLMDEYEKVLKYSQDLYKSLVPIEEAAEGDLGKAPSMEEIKALVKTLKASITESIDVAKGTAPPDYMADSHVKYVDVLVLYGAATDDFLYALQLTDPLRINATSYRYELLSNKLMYIGDEMDADIGQEEKKMIEQGDKLQKSQDELYKQLLIWEGQYNVVE